MTEVGCLTTLSRCGGVADVERMADGGECCRLTVAKDASRFSPFRRGQDRRAGLSKGESLRIPLRKESVQKFILGRIYLPP